MKNLLFLGSGLSSSKEYEKLYHNVLTAIQFGISSFDTAPSYHTEEALGQAIHTIIVKDGVKRSDLHLQTKIDPWQMVEGDGRVEKYVIESLDKMQTDYFDAVLIHWPIPEYFYQTIDSLMKLKQQGTIRHVGICNVRVRHLVELEKEMKIQPEIIQIERNPLRVCQAEVEYCMKKHISVQAYSPLCKMNERLRKNDIIKSIAENYHKSVGQVILRWHIDTGCIPIFTSTKTERIKEYSQIFDFQLTSQEIEQVSLLNENYKMYLESWSCPGF